MSWKLRTGPALAAAAMLLVAAMGGGPAPGATVTPARLHIGPLGLNVPLGDGDDDVVLAATNLGDAARDATLTLFDQDVQQIDSRQMTILPQRTGVLVALLLPAVQAVRGRVVSPEGGRWAVSLGLVGTDSGYEGLTDRAVTQSRAPTGAATSALMPAGSQSLGVYVLNIGPDIHSFTVRLLDAAGDQVASGRLRNIERGRISFIAFDPAVAVRATVTGPSDAKFLATVLMAQEGGGLILGNLLYDL